MDYKSQRWEHVRGRILRRDRYICRECGRYGKTSQANVVHHIWPASQYPMYAWSGWNLVSLCQTCHNAMHDRDSDALTEKGESWRRRTPPPSGK